MTMANGIQLAKCIIDLSEGAILDVDLHPRVGIQVSKEEIRLRIDEEWHDFAGNLEAIPALVVMLQARAVLEESVNFLKPPQDQQDNRQSE